MCLCRCAHPHMCLWQSEKDIRVPAVPLCLIPLIQDLILSLGLGPSDLPESVPHSTGFHGQLYICAHIPTIKNKINLKKGEKKICLGAREMAPCLRAFVLTEDWSLFPITYIQCLLPTEPCNSSSRPSAAFFWLPWALHSHVEVHKDIYVNQKINHQK